MDCKSCDGVNPSVTFDIAEYPPGGKKKPNASHQKVKMPERRQNTKSGGVTTNRLFYSQWALRKRDKFVVPVFIMRTCGVGAFAKNVFGIPLQI